MWGKGSAKCYVTSPESRYASYAWPQIVDVNNAADAAWDRVVNFGPWITRGTKDKTCGPQSGGDRAPALPDGLREGTDCVGSVTVQVGKVFWGGHFVIKLVPYEGCPGVH